MIRRQLLILSERQRKLSLFIGSRLLNLALTRIAISDVSMEASLVGLLGILRFIAALRQVWGFKFFYRSGRAYFSSKETVICRCKV